MRSSFSSRHSEPAHELMPGHVLQKSCMLVSSSWRWASWGVTASATSSSLESASRKRSEMSSTGSLHHAVSVASSEAGLAASPNECGRWLCRPQRADPCRALRYGGVDAGLGSARELRGLVNPAGDEEIAMRPDEELLGVVVHSGLVLARSQDVVAALRRITALPAGLSLDAVVLARDVHAEAAGRREHAATAHRWAAGTAQREDEAAAQRDSEAAAQREGVAAAERRHALRQIMIERRYLPSF